MKKPFLPLVSAGRVFGRSSLISVLCLVASVFGAQRAYAQIYEAVGTRAQGMGGAFVAVADDASATWWNPAGIATGAYLSAVIERTSLDDPGNPSNSGPARRDASNGFAVALPSLGLSYYSLRVGEVRPATGAIGATSPGRQDEGAAGVDLRALTYKKFGVTIGQSFTSHLVLASTVSLLRGGVGASTEAPSSDGLDHATDLDVGGETHGDIDLGAMVKAGVLRLGVNVKHVTQPSFGSGDSEVQLGRQGRAGIAIETRGTTPLTLSADVDLSKTPTVNGDAQHIAGGVELWLSKRKLGVRGGVSANLVDGKRTSASSGLSFALKPGMYVDGALTFGSDTARSGWGASLRAAF